MGNRFREKVVEDDLEEPRQPEADAPAAAGAPGEASGAAGQAGDSRADRTARGIGRVLGADAVVNRLLAKYLPLVLLCVLYLLVMVRVRYRIETLSLEKAASEKRIVYLREHRIQMQKQYQQSIKISQIADDLRERGVGITSGPPYEIEK